MTVPLTASSDSGLAARVRDLERRLGELDSLLVAFSGGADSALLLAAAVRTLGAARVVAATAVSASLPSAELGQAREFARDLGVRHLSPATDEMSRAGYTANAADRCFHCKSALLDALVPLAGELGIAAIATGTNADDLVAGFRPGIRAAALAGALTPLADAGLTKADVRSISRDWGLVTADKPAAACLSSRVAYGISITPAGLGRIERAEAALRERLLDAGLPLRNLRVRDLGGRARVEVDASLVDTLLSRPDLLGAVLGFDSVTVDERGFRSGSMNDALASPGR
jgi:uncharacterized protein